MHSSCPVAIRMMSSLAVTGMGRDKSYLFGSFWLSTLATLFAHATQEGAAKFFREGFRPHNSCPKRRKESEFSLQQNFVHCSSGNCKINRYQTCFSLYFFLCFALLFGRLIAVFFGACCPWRLVPRTHPSLWERLGFFLKDFGGSGTWGTLCCTSPLCLSTGVVFPILDDLFKGQVPRKQFFF